MSNAFGGRLAACHTLELPFAFDNLRLPALHGPEALLDPAAAWTRFAGIDTPGWAPFNPLIPTAEILGPAPHR